MARNTARVPSAAYPRFGNSNFGQLPCTLPQTNMEAHRRPNTEDSRAVHGRLSTSILLWSSRWGMASSHAPARLEAEPLNVDHPEPLTFYITKSAQKRCSCTFILHYHTLQRAGTEASRKGTYQEVPTSCQSFQLKSGNGSCRPREAGDQSLQNSLIENSSSKHIGALVMLQGVVFCDSRIQVVTK